MSKKILEIEGLYESTWHDSHRWPHYDLRVGEKDVAEAVREKLGVLLEGVDIVSLDDYISDSDPPERVSTLKLRVTVEVLEGEVS